jgi:DNA-binding CsgD family transcriptional regulator
MAEQSTASGLMSVRNGCATPHMRQVGRIDLGDRQFVVMLDSALRSGTEHAQVCRFELGGLGLIIVEEGHKGHGSAIEATDDVASRLTGRELEIAILVAQGHANKNIAYRLRISEWTVATYLRRIFAKLNVESRAAMVFRCAPLITASLEPAYGRDGRRPAHG